MADSHIVRHQHLLKMRPQQCQVAEIIDLQSYGDIGQLAINKRSDKGAAVRFRHLGAFEQVPRQIDLPMGIDLGKRGLPSGQKARVAVKGRRGIFPGRGLLYDAQSRCARWCLARDNIKFSCGLADVRPCLLYTSRCV